MSGGIPTAWPSASPGPVRFGPSTAPTVVAQTTIDSARPREASVARSVAAKRDWRFAVCPAPISRKATSSSGKIRVAPARSRRAPRRRARSPCPWSATSAGPLAGRARRAGRRKAAVPNVTAAAASPESESSPEMSAASTAPSDSVAPKAIPPRICPIESTQHRPPLDRGECLGARSGFALGMTSLPYAARAVLRRMPSPVISTSTVSPATKGPTPAGVPVRMTSPGRSVKAADA